MACVGVCAVSGGLPDYAYALVWDWRQETAVLVVKCRVKLFRYSQRAAEMDFLEELLRGRR